MKNRLYASVVIMVVALGAISIAAPASADPPALEDRIMALEAQVAALQDQVNALPPALYSKNESFSYPVGQSSNTLLCNSGDKATGGGYRLHSSVHGIDVLENNQTLSLSGWLLLINNTAGSATSAEIFVVCRDDAP